MTGIGRRRPIAPTLPMERPVMATKSLRLNFTGSSGAELAARLDLPEGTVRAYALFAHCFTCSKDILAARCIARGTLYTVWLAILRTARMASAGPTT